MNKKVFSLKYTIFFSLIIALICGSMLVFTQHFLKDKIETNRLLDKYKAIFTLSGIDTNGFSSDELKRLFKEQIHIEKLNSDKIRYSYIKNKNLICYIYEMKGPGFWGEIKGFIAFDPQLFKIKGIIITIQEETPGLGGEISQAWFQNKFKNKKFTISPKDSKIILHLKKSGTSGKFDIDGITGATETTNRFDSILQSVFKLAITNRNQEKSN